jgi:hypothetical protein
MMPDERSIEMVEHGAQDSLAVKDVTASGRARAKTTEQEVVKQEVTP